MYTGVFPLLVVVFALANVSFSAVFRSPEFLRHKRNNDIQNFVDDHQYHGTTTLSFIHKNSVIIAVDSRASIGTFIGSSDVNKIFPISKTVVSTMAGGAADCAQWIRQVRKKVNLLKYNQHSLGSVGASWFGANEVSVVAVAKLYASELAKERHQGLSIGTMICGFDGITGPSIYYVDSEGSCVQNSCFCVGSGASVAYGALENSLFSGNSSHRSASISSPHLASGSPIGNVGSSGFADAGAGAGYAEVDGHDSLQHAINTAARAIRISAGRDGYSGGFINVVLVNSSGTFHVFRQRASLVVV